MKNFFLRQSIIPFETTFAVFCVYSGIAGILEFGPTNYGFAVVLGKPISIVFNLAYILGGLGLYFGIGFNRRNIESFGLILIAMSLLVRSIALLHFAGLNTNYISIHVYSAGFIIGCIVRLSFLIKDKVIIQGDALSELFDQLEKLKSQIPHRAN